MVTEAAAEFGSKPRRLAVIARQPFGQRANEIPVRVRPKHLKPSKALVAQTLPISPEGTLLGRIGHELSPYDIWK
jgi:hypothetical protein